MILEADKLSAYFHFQMLLQEVENNAPEINVTAYLNLGAIYSFLKIMIKRNCSIKRA